MTTTNTAPTSNPTTDSASATAPIQQPIATTPEGAQGPRLPPGINQATAAAFFLAIEDLSQVVKGLADKKDPKKSDIQKVVREYIDRSHYSAKPYIAIYFVEHFDAMAANDLLKPKKDRKNLAMPFFRQARNEAATCWCALRGKWRFGGSQLSEDSAQVHALLSMRESHNNFIEKLKTTFSSELSALAMGVHKLGDAANELINANVQALITNQLNLSHEVGGLKARLIEAEDKIRTIQRPLAKPGEQEQLEITKDHEPKGNGKKASP